MISSGEIIALILAYLLGSIPSAVWVGKVFYGKDVREYGSGNSGATNTFRVLGVKAGIPVLMMDILKGWIAVNFTFFFGDYPEGSNQFVNFQLVLGIGALLGHIFPVYVGFRGGKGIATLLGIILAVHLHGALVALGVFVFMFLIFRFVSLSSMAAAISFPFIIIMLFKEQAESLVVFSMFIACVVLITHQKNIERLLRKEESKMSFGKKKKQEKEFEFED